MHFHGPCTVRGPLTLDRPWWMEFKRQPPKRSADAGVRADLVARCRRQIAAGTYDTPERWEAALDKLAERLDRA